MGVVTGKVTAEQERDELRALVMKLSLCDENMHNAFNHLIEEANKLLKMQYKRYEK